MESFDYWAQLQNNSFHRTSETPLELSPDLSHSTSLSVSPVMSDFDSFAPPQLYQAPFGQLGTEDTKFPYQLPMTPSDFGSADDSAYCSPTPGMAELSFPPLQSPIQATSIPVSRSSSDRTHATSGRRRAQNRAAQRAFRERKEKHARDLEDALSALTEKYQSLETSHTELTNAYEKLKRTIELLTKDDDAGGGIEAKSGHSKETLRNLLEIIHGEVGSRAAAAKK